MNLFRYLTLRLVYFLFCYAGFVHAQYKGTASVTQGLATRIDSNLFVCTNGRPTHLGEIISSDRNKWIVPSTTNYKNISFPWASDLYNPCTGKNYNNFQAALSALNGSDIIEIEKAGELITAFIFADNYFELYINGVPVGKDNVPYTQFNSNIVRFRVKRPFTIAMLLVDWEENLGLGSENNTGLKYYNGDGGMVAVFKDEKMNTIAYTSKNWKAQTYYTSPIKDLNCPIENGNLRLSSNCSTSGTNDGSLYYALHWAKPNQWMNRDFNDQDWPTANEYTNTEVGVNNKPSFTNFTEVFDEKNKDAQFIWSSNLILDNEVIVRYQVESSTETKTSSKEQVNFYMSNGVLFNNLLELELINELKLIVICNSIGQTVYQSDRIDSHLNVEDLRNGFYFIILEFKQNHWINKYFIKN